MRFQKTKPRSAMRVAVIDMQPISPPIGGGRQRLLGVWHDLGADFTANYVGTYDWPGQSACDNQVSETLRELTVPLSDAHFSALPHFLSAAGSQSLVDTIFHALVPASAKYLEAARAAIKGAEIVAFCHPWAYPALADQLHGKIVIYDSHNVELMLKAPGLSRNPLGRDLVRSVARVEGALIDRADMIFTCSTEDKNAFSLLYGVDRDCIEVIPNGVFLKPLGSKSSVKSDGNRDITCLFLGSDFGPNREAAKYIVETLATENPDIRFDIVGSVSENPSVVVAQRGRSNVTLHGVVTDERKSELLRLAHIALNPIFSGSGTNIKMFDYMASGLPIVSTPTGARGITRYDRAGVLVREASDFSNTIRELKLSSRQRENFGRANRELAEIDYSWTTISRRAASAIQRRLQFDQKPMDKAEAPASQTDSRRPHISVDQVTVISTFGIKCGIAEYAASFVDALQDLGVKIHVIAASTPSSHPSKSKFAVTVGWHYDDERWVDSKFDPMKIMSAILDRGSGQHINIQYHPAFYSSQTLIEFVRMVHQNSMSVSITLHNSRDIAVETVSILSGLGASILVHSEKEQERLGGYAYYLPFGINRGRIVHKPAPSVKIGTFGFLRPHKGVSELISAMPIVRSVYPTASLHAICAVCDAPDSAEEERRCRALISELKLGDCITLDTNFLSKEEIESAMSSMSLAVFAYKDSAEGASAAANAAIGAEIPVITSRSGIFDPIENVVSQFEDTTPAGVAFAILDFLGNIGFQAILAERASAYREAHSWRTVAERFCATAMSDREQHLEVMA